MSVESSGGVSVSAVGALTGVSGGSSSYVSGGSVSVSGAEGVSGVFGAGAELTASAVRVSSSSVLDASTAGSVSVRVYIGPSIDHDVMNQPGMVNLALWIGSDAVGVEEQMSTLIGEGTLLILGKLMIG